MKFLSYDSPLMRLLAKVADIMILNLLFLLCSIPLVTQGAAQAGLFTAMKVFRDKENDSSCVKAFFRGFSAGFRRITVLWCAFLVMFVLLLGSAVGTWFFSPIDPQSPTILAWAALCILGLIETLAVLFHFRFDCTVWHLLRNAVLFICAYPLRSVLIFAQTWAPLGLVLMDTYLFMKLTPIFLLAYFSLSSWLVLRITDKPFQKMME